MKLLTSLLLTFTTGFFPPDSIRYNLEIPDRVHMLPDTLHEISGIVHTGDNTIACVQDENGIIFFYDTDKKTIVRQVRFGENGDYEDIAFDGNTFFVLRSDGVIFEISDIENTAKVSEHYTGIPAKNNEGLCYDETNNRLLIAVKGKSGKGKRAKNHRDVFAFDLNTRKLSSKPVLSMNVEQMKERALAAGISLPVKYKKKGKVRENVLKLSSSAVAIHPKTKDVYILSSADHLLIVFDRNLQFQQMVKLDQIRFNKAEGMTFTPDGRLFISNEGGHSTPTMLTFAEK